MHYATGGINGTVGQALQVEVPLQGKAQPKEDPKPAQAAGPAGPVVKESGEDVIVDPPVRNLPQWDKRWGHTRMAGKATGAMLDWQENGCNASTAAMTLRWFAEDCPAGKIPFPMKAGHTIDKSWYSPLMAEFMWPNANPPGKVSLTSAGTIDTTWIFAAAAYYLSSGGDMQRADNGDIAHFSKNAYTVENEPAEGWMSLLRKMLKTGPVIMGIGAPAGHYVIAHAIIGGKVAIVDPGNVLCTAKKGGGGSIQNWSSMSGYLDGTSDPDKVRMPKDSQWPGGSAPGNEGDGRAYNLVSDQFLSTILNHLHRLVSLTYPDGAKFGGTQQSQPQSQSQQSQSQSQPDDDRPLPATLDYKGGHDMKKKDDGTDWPPSTPGKVKFIKEKKPPQPDAWKGCQFREHSHFHPEACVDMNKESDKSYGFFPDIYGPAVPFTPLADFIWGGFGGVVRCKLDNGRVVEFGHFDHISAEIYYAAKDKKQLPAGTFLGKTTTIIGLSSGVHCHMQGRSGVEGGLLTRDVWLEWLGIPPERRWWKGKK